MESNYRNNEFEQYIKENAEQYRMFPSDKVWKGINSTLHTRRKWYGFWLAFLLLLTGGSVTWVMTTHPVSKKQDTTLNNNSTLIAGKIAAVKSPDIKDLLPFNKQSVLAFTPEAEKNIIDNPAAIQEVPVSTIDHLQISQQYSEFQTEIKQHAIVNKITVDIPLFTTSEQLPISIEHPFENKETPILARNKSTSRKDEVYSPLTIESVLNAYRFQKRAKKISWQLFVTPTISYRRLSANKSADNPSASNYPFASLADVNSAVTHKPDLGLQIGVSGGYPITKSLKIRGGLQFNVNRYDIKAYAFNGEVATIDLNGGNGNSSISTWTYYRNYSGYKSDWLKNFYFSVSAPVGAELKLFGNKKTNFGIAGTIQPTYIINDKAYLISTDYKNYAEVPRLIRHVNLNTGFETFVNYTSGKTKWQIGPQVRYQLLSSFHNKYPIKENLFDFGLKVGVTLNE